MDIQEVNVVIEKDGRVRLEVHGIKGLSCLEVTRPLEELLGGQLESREMRPEAIEETLPGTEERDDLRHGSH